MDDILNAEHLAGVSIDFNYLSYLHENELFYKFLKSVSNVFNKLKEKNIEFTLNRDWDSDIFSP